MKLSPKAAETVESGLPPQETRLNEDGFLL